MSSKVYDVLVVGAGILGLSISYHVKKNNPNKEVLMIDRFGTLAQGNTARSNAMFRNTFTSSDNIILSDTSINFYLEVQHLGIDLGLKKCGYLWLMSERQLSKNASNIRRLEEAKIELRHYSKEDLKRALPSLNQEPLSEEARMMGLEEVNAGIFGVKCGRIDPSKLSRYYADRFVELGGKSAFNTNATSLIVEPSEELGIDGEPFPWQNSEVRGVRSQGALSGEIRAKKTIIAAGVWNNQLLEPIGVDGHVKAKKRQLFTVSARSSEGLENLLQAQGFDNGSVLPFVILPKHSCFVKGVEENHEFWLGCEDDFNRPFINVPDPSLDDCKAEQDYFDRTVHPLVSEYFREFGGSKLNQMWAGYYSYNTLDSIPFVFEENGLIVAGGGSGSGIMKGDAMGRIVDGLYSNGESADAILYGGVQYPVSKLGFSHRSVEREEWVI